MTRNTRKDLAAGALLALGVASTAGLVGTIIDADAHVPTVHADCRVLSVDLVDYEPHTTVTIIVDDQTARYTFDASFHKAIPYAPDQPHVWTVSVDNRGDDHHDEWDATWKGSSTPCVAPTTTRPKVINVDLTPPTTTAAPVADIPVVVIPPAVLERTPTAAPAPALAFTGSHTTAKLTAAWTLIAAGALAAFVARRRAASHPGGTAKR